MEKVPHPSVLGLTLKSTREKNKESWGVGGPGKPKTKTNFRLPPQLNVGFVGVHEPSPLSGG